MSKGCSCAAFVLLGCLAVIATASTKVGPVQVDTSYGPIVGKTVDNARLWLGIPYASPPVGNLRWMAAALPTSWSKPLETKEFKPACPQHCNLPPVACQAQVSEDCLYINVYSPLTVEDEDDKRPVLVFFHGGRFQQGSEGVELYDGRNIANLTNTVVVTVNYRLGVLGFMAGVDGTEGNYGVRDQRLALEWVRDNIAGFNGDRNNVTIFGQSAGASSVSFHMVATGSQGLFHRVIIESSPYSLPLLDMKLAGKHYDHFVDETPCSKNRTAACLRSLTWDQVVNAQSIAEDKIYLIEPLSLFFPWTPIVDGNDLVEDPLTAYQKGNFAKVPVVIGHVGQEAWLFVYEAFKSLPKIEAELLIEAIFSKHGVPKRLFEMYPMPKHADDYRPWLAVVASDFIFICPMRNASRQFIEHDLPVYDYNFDHAWVEHGAWGPNYTYCEGHPCHGVELPFVFDSAALSGYNFTEGEISLSKTMARYWGFFATNSAPASPDIELPQWPKFDVKNQYVLHMQPNNLTAIANPRGEYCDFWDSVGYDF